MICEPNVKRKYVNGIDIVTWKVVAQLKTYFADFLGNSYFSC
jgi:hypothetical protein